MPESPKVEIPVLDLKEIKERLIRLDERLIKLEESHADLKEKLTYLERLLTRVTARK